jgi:hypothetical protein
MVSLGGLFKGIGIGDGSNLVGNAVTIVVGVVILCICGFGLWWYLRRRKKWNIKVEFKIPRNLQSIEQKDGTTKVTGNLNKEWGKGYYDSARGVCYVKRNKKKAVPMKPFDIKQFLSTDNILTVLQTGIEDYRPVLDDSYIEVVDSATGEEAALIKAKIDTSESKSWKHSFERDANSAYSIKNWISEHGGLVAMGLVLMMNLIGFAIVISRMPK